MGNYQSRLDRIEAAIAPKDDFHVLMVHEGETNELALARFAGPRGIRPDEVRGTVIYFTEADAALL